MPQNAVRGPGAKFDLCYEFRANPDDPLFLCSRALEGRRLVLERLQLAHEIGGGFLVESSSDSTRRLQCLAIVITEHERGEFAPRGLRRDIADDQEFLSLRAFRFDPILPASAAIERAGAFGDDAFKTHPARLPQHRLTRFEEMFAVAQSAFVAGRK